MQVNYPDAEIPFTRIVEIKHATGQHIAATTIVREFPKDWTPGDEPYYPVPAPDARAAYQKYAELAAAEPTPASSAASPPTATTTWTRSPPWPSPRLTNCSPATETSREKIVSSKSQIHDLRPSTFDLRPSTFDLRPSTFDLRPSTLLPLPQPSMVSP